MRAGLILLGLAAAVFSAAAAPSAIDRLTGGYHERLDGKFSDGRPYTSRRDLEVLRLDGTAAFFRTEIVYPNQHTCGLSGIAALEGSALVYRTRDGPKLCTLTITARGDKVVLNDAGSCNDYCGAAASFDGIAFQASRRKPISDPNRLLKSRDYATAVAERKKGGH